MKLKGKVVIVVGGGSGIGRASAKLLAQEGAKVMIADRNIEGANKVADEIKAAGGEVSTVETNMIEEEEAINMVNVTLKKYGKIDILCNIAGGSVGRYIRDKQTPFRQSTKEEWDTQIAVNLTGCRNCSRAVINHMIERGSGKIVNFSSMAGVEGTPGVVDYSAAKAGVIGFTKALAHEMAPYGIQVNCIAPSGVLTERIEAFARAMKEKNPQAPGMDTSKLAKPEEIANTVLFLVSDDVSHISGDVIGFAAAR
jgi:3-oxoacyl-[acyl-carrier protein] reductase